VLKVCIYRKNLIENREEREPMSKGIANNYRHEGNLGDNERNGKGGNGRGGTSIGFLDSFTWDRYLTYDEMTRFLTELASTYRDLCQVYSIGRTWQGRDIWCVEVTNQKTGKASEKPALYIDGNTHAGEVTGSMIALYTIWYLVSHYSKDPKISSLVDTRTFYVVPRLSCDGAELYLTSPYIPRSSIRPWPYETDEPGLVPEDIDGDGIIAQMRIPDENGEWRISEKDPRVMVKRRPHEVGGTYYRILPEGLINDFNGAEIKGAPSKWGLDINRNYGANWRQDYIQRGSGPYPFSEPESRAVAEFFQNHKNIVLAQSYHTFTGAILRPPASKPDKEYSPKDLKAMKEIGAVGTEITGYPCLGVFEDFQLSKDLAEKRPLWGSALEWMYEHAGVIAYSTEVWDMPNRAIGRKDTYKTLMEWSEDEEILMQKWNDENLGGEGFIDWRQFNHPQLGPVEIGGWKHKFVIQNPPPKYLREECEKNTLFTLACALSTPLVRITSVQIKERGEGVYEVRAVVRNMGYLPTNVTDQAVKAKIAEEVKAEIRLPEKEGVELVGCDKKVSLGHLEGRLAVGRAFGGLRQMEHLCRWVVTVKDKEEPVILTIRAGSPRGGYDEKEAELPKAR